MKRSPLAAHFARALPVLTAALLGCASTTGGSASGNGGAGGHQSGTGTSSGGHESGTGGTGGAAATGLEPGVLGSVVLEGTSIVLTDGLVGKSGGRLARVDTASGEVTTLFQGSWLNQVVGGGVVADATNYYFVIQDLAVPSSRIVALPRTGGTPVPLTPPGDYGWFLVNTSHLYWFSEQGIMEAPIHGGTGTVVPGTERVGGFAVDDQTMYWSRWVGTSGATEIVSAPVAGGPVTVLAQGLLDAPDVELGSDVLYLLDYGPGSTDCAGGPGTASTMPKSGGPVQPFAQGFFDIGLFTVSGNTLVFDATLSEDGCNGEPTTYPRVVIRIDGNGPAQQIDSGNFPSAIATDGTDVYIVGETAHSSTPTVRVVQ